MDPGHGGDPVPRQAPGAGGPAEQRGALIGFAAGLGLGLACASEEGGMGAPSDEGCAAGYIVMGTATGALIGLLIKSDLWAPTVLPSRPGGQEPPVALVR